MASIIKEIMRQRKMLKEGKLQKADFLALPPDLRCLIPVQSTKFSTWTFELPDFSGEQLIDGLVHSNKGTERLYLSRSSLLKKSYFDDILDSWSEESIHYLVNGSPVVDKPFLKKALELNKRDVTISVISHPRFDEFDSAQAFIEKKFGGVLCSNPNLPLELLEICVENDFRRCAGSVYFHPNCDEQLQRKIEQEANSYSYPIDWIEKTVNSDGSYEGNEDIEELIREFAKNSDLEQLHEVFFADKVTYGVGHSLGANSHLSSKLVKRLLSSDLCFSVIQNPIIDDETVRSIIESDTLGHKTKYLIETGRVPESDILKALEKWPVLVETVAQLDSISDRVLEAILTHCYALLGTKYSSVLIGNVNEGALLVDTTSSKKKTANIAFDYLLNRELPADFLDLLPDGLNPSVKLKAMGQEHISGEMRDKLLSDKKVLRSLDKTAHLPPEMLEELGEHDSTEVRELARLNTNHPAWRETMIKQPHDNPWFISQFG